MSERPDALLCAEVLEAARDDPMWANHAEITKEACARSAAELRRLHELNVDKTEIIAAISAQRDALLEALRSLLSYANVLEMRLLDADGEHRAMQQARAAVAKAEGQT